MGKEKSKKNKDISFGRRHYWTDTQGYAHRVVFDDASQEKPRATWIVLTTVTILSLVVGVALIVSDRSDSQFRPVVEPVASAPSLVFATTIDAGVASRATAIAAGWNDELFLGDDSGVSLFDATGKKLDSWSFDETVPPTALAFVSDENSSDNGLLLVAFPEKVKALRFSLDQLVPADGAGDYALPGDADDEIEANNAVARTAARGAIGTPTTLLTQTGADFRGIACAGDRLFVADYKSQRVWRRSLKRLAAAPDDGATPPDLELGEPDDARDYPGLKPAFRRNFCLSFVAEKNALYVANSGVFRVDAFDPETGAWLSDLSWSKTPGAPDAFRGASNPIAIVAEPSLIVAGESGVFMNDATKGRFSPVRLFDDSGRWLVDLAADYSSRPNDLTVVSVAASRELKRVYALYSDGSVDVWERR